MGAFFFLTLIQLCDEEGCLENQSCDQQKDNRGAFCTNKTWVCRSFAGERANCDLSLQEMGMIQVRDLGLKMAVSWAANGFIKGLMTFRARLSRSGCQIVTQGR